MKMSKRFFCAVLAAALVACIAGCGKQDPVYLSEYSYYEYDDNGNTNSGSTTTTTTNKDNKQGGSNTDAVIGHGSAGNVQISKDLLKKLDGTTVKVLYWKDYTDEEKAVIKKFEDQTGMKIKTERAMHDEDPYTELIANKMASKAGFDVVMFNYKTFPGRPLTVMQPLNKISNFNVGDWDQDVVNAFKIKNNIYGVNINGSNNSEYDVMYFNETMFRNQGVATPRELYAAGNWNWDTFLDTAKKMTVKNSDGSTTYGYVNLHSGAVVYWTLSGGVDFISYDASNSTFKCNLGDATLKSSLEFYFNLAKNKVMDPTFPYGPDTFQQGKAAMFSCLVYHAMKAGSQFKNMTDTLDIVPFPMPKGREDYLPVDASAFGVLQGAENPEGAIEFLKYFLDPKNFDKADMFINSNMLDTFGKCANMKKLVSYSRGVVDYAALTTFNDISQNLQQAGADQIDTVLAKYKSNFNLSVDKANKKIGELD